MLVFDADPSKGTETLVFYVHEESRGKFANIPLAKDDELKLDIFRRFPGPQTLAWIQPFPSLYSKLSCCVFQPYLTSLNIYD